MITIMVLIANFLIEILYGFIDPRIKAAQSDLRRDAVMKHTLKQVFRSGKFVVGFSILMSMLLIVIIYPLFVRYPPLEIIGQGTFFPPGIYVSVYDSIGSPLLYTLIWMMPLPSGLPASWVTRSAWR